MAKSLAKLKEQIAKLQKEADVIQQTVIARIKREIAQHGLTSAHLFDSTDSTFIGNGAKTASTAPKTKSAAKTGEKNPAKFADDQGNSWHGLGKRPAWIHEALAAGRSLGDFLIGAKKAAPAAKAPKAEVKATTTVKKVAAKKQPVAAKKAAKATKVTAATLPAAKGAAKKAVKTTPAKKAAAKKTARTKAVKAVDAAAPAPT